MTPLLVILPCWLFAIGIELLIVGFFFNVAKNKEDKR